MEFQGKKIVVTGAARGIGRALCERFVREGIASLVLADIDLPLAQQVATWIQTQSRVPARAVACDVSRESEIQHLVEQAEVAFGGIDLFCANAGIAPSGGVDASDEIWKAALQVNFMSHVYSSRAVLPSMIERGAGHLLHVASAAGLLTSLGSAPYAVSKHAALALAEWLAITHFDQGIRVSCVCPLGVFTDMIERDEPAIRMLHESAITADEVAEAVVIGLRRDDFLIAPHPQAVEFFRNKARDYERWLGGMRKIQRQLDSLS